MNDDKLLVSFLRETADAIENKTLTENQVSLIGEFYMSYRFQNRLEEIQEEDYIKFLVLGWYIYTVILRQRNRNVGLTLNDV